MNVSSSGSYNRANIFLGLIEYELNSLLGALHLVDYISVHIRFDLERYLLNSISVDMFTLYRIGFCSVSKVVPVQCEHELMFCCGAEIVPKRSQCEQKSYPSYNLQRSLLI